MTMKQGKQKPLPAAGRAAWRYWIQCRAGLALLAFALTAFTGCQSDESALDLTPQKTPPGTNSPTPGRHANGAQRDALLAGLATPPPATNQVITLREGDQLKISFPGSPSLNNVQIIRKDGMITLPLIGDTKAAGETPASLAKKLSDLYAPQISTKEVIVEAQSAPITIYVTGAVLRPGKILSDHKITALEAVMEAGGFDYTRADMKHVIVIRKETDGTKNYSLDLKAVMDGKSSQPFYLKPEDIIFVKEKFTWF